jgi:uncharacterized protein (TIGR02246 family)
MCRCCTPLLALAGVLACAQPAPAPPPVDEAAVRSGVNAVWTAYTDALLAENAEGVLALYSEDAYLDFKDMPPLEGRAALAEAMAPLLAANDYTALTIMPTTTYVVSDSLALQAGTYHETWNTPADRTTTAAHGRWAAGLAREPDGRWRINYLMAFTDSTTTAKAMTAK